MVQMGRLRWEGWGKKRWGEVKIRVLFFPNAPNIHVKIPDRQLAAAAEKGRLSESLLLRWEISNHQRRVN